MKNLKVCKVVVFLCVVAFSLCLFSSCSLLGPKSAEDVIEKYKANQEDFENCNMKGKLNMNMTMSSKDKELTELAGTTSFEIPVVVDFDVDAGKDSSYGRLDMKLSFMGVSESQKIEMYIDNRENLAYLRAEDGDWVKEDLDSDESVTSFADLNDLGSDIWKDFDFKKTDNGYVLSASSKVIKDSDMFNSITGTLGDDTISNFDLSEDGEIVYEFDKHCNLTKVNMSEIKLKGKTAETDLLGSFDCEADLDVSVNLSKYNELKESAYEIPDKIKDSAKEQEDDGSLFSLGGSSEDGLDDISSEPIDNTPSEPAQTPTEKTPAKSNNVVLSGADVNGDSNKYCFIVGEDVPAGTYKIYKLSGSGVISAHDTKDIKQKFSYSIGFGLEDDMKDGQEIVLSDGDEVYVTEELVVELKK